MKNHQKYAHSEDKTHACVLCDVKFKQKKDMRTHVLHVYGFNMSKSMYGNLEEPERYECDMCDSSYRYKKDLNMHKRKKHEETDAAENNFPCDECSSIFKAKKTLNTHRNLKHSNSISEFPCPTCGKVYNQKNNMKRHSKTHEK